MNIDVDVLFPEIKVDLLKHGSMGDFFDEQLLTERAGNKAMEDMIQMLQARRLVLLRRVVAKVLPGVSVSPQRLHRLCEAIPEIEAEASPSAIWYLFFDAHLAAWEKALVPTDEEIRSAMQYSARSMPTLARRPFWDYVLSDEGDEVPGVKGWRPGRTWTNRQLTEEALRKISFVHEPGQPAYLIFKFAEMEPTKALLNHVLTISESDASWVLGELQEEFKDWAEFYITGVTQFLLSNLNAASRISIEPQLDKLLEKPETLESIQRELQQALGV